MGNSPTRHDSSASSFRENSKQYREYRALENKIRLLKIQANNYNGIGKDAIYTDMFASVQDTIRTVAYLRDKSKSSNRKIEYDMLDAELKSCLQIMSSKMHQKIEPKPVDGRPNRVPEQNQNQPKQHEQKNPGDNGHSLQNALDSLETRINQLKNNFAQFSNNHGDQNSLSQLESTGKDLYKNLDSLVAPNNAKKLYLREILQDILNDIASKQLELYRKSRYDNLEVSSEPTDPNLQLLLKMEKSLSVFRDKTYLTAESRDVAKLIDTLTCYKNDLHNFRITSKDVNKKQVELLGFIDSTINFLKENESTNNQKGTADVVDKPHQSVKDEPLIKSIQDELNKIQTSANQNSYNENHLKRILDLLEHVNNSLQRKATENDNHQYRGSSDDVRKATAKTTLQTALERKGYRKTFLANTMIKQHAAKMKRSSASSDTPDPDYSMIDDGEGSPGGHRNSTNLGTHYNDKFMRPNSPAHSDLGGGGGGGGGNQFNSLSTSGTTNQQITPNSPRRQDNRSNNKALKEIEDICRALDQLRARVDRFNDSRQSALYEELETLLLELLVRLEHVQSDSRVSEVTDILVYAIRDTQQVLYVLDERALKYKPQNKYAR